MFQILMRASLMLALAAGASLNLAGCDLDDSDRKSPAPAAAAATPVLGTFTTTVTHNTQNELTPLLGTSGGECSDPPFDDVFTLVIADVGGQIALTSSDEDVSAIGTLNGNVLTFTYSFPDGSGTTTSNVTLAFGSTSGGTLFDFFTGEATYTFNNPLPFTCTGTDRWAGARFKSPPPGGEGLTGNWNLTLTPKSSTCEVDPAVNVTIPVVVVQVGNETTITLPGIAVFNGSLNTAGTTMNLFAEYDQAPLSVVAEGLLDVSADQNTISGNVVYDYSNSATMETCVGAVNWNMVRIGGFPNN